MMDLSCGHADSTFAKIDDAALLVVEHGALAILVLPAHVLC